MSTSLPRKPPASSLSCASCAWSKLSVPTVKAHVSRLLMKLEVENRVQIALLVQEASRDYN